MAEKARLQIKTTANPEHWEDVGVLSIGGYPLPVEIAGGELAYAVNHVDNSTTANTVFIGKEDKSGEWEILRVDRTGAFPVFEYATETNNPALTTYGAAWTARVGATYNIFSSAF
jgi:hypothetical protein